ncbi:MAG: hypothetical protein GY832_28165 [Chloroflexi bacterium]|nr:hypothetical protein [Chloroflexota bacterium]
MPKIQILNCFILIVPVLVWNAIFASKLPAGYSSDAGVSQAIMILENVLRIPVFFYPILLALQINDRYSKTGIIIYVVGVAVYFVSWIMQLYFQETRWSTSALGILAPAYTPLIWLLGIGLIGRSWLYASISALFVFVHVWHNVQVFGF